jgi:O-antigen ligase
MLVKSRFKLATTCLITSAMLLTGSLTGVVSVTLGWAASLVIRRSLKYSMKQILRLAAPVLALALLVFTVLATSNSVAHVDLGSVIWDRLEPIVETRSMEASNRSYTWDYIVESPPSLFGVGLGNANLRFGQYLHILPVPSFLSLYFNIAYSTGLVGLIFLARFLLMPVLGFIKRSTLHPPELVAAYIAYLVAFSVHSEELSFQFAILYALATWQGNVRRPEFAPQLKTDSVALRPVYNINPVARV